MSPPPLTSGCSAPKCSSCGNALLYEPDDRWREDHGRRERGAKVKKKSTKPRKKGPGTPTILKPIVASTAATRFVPTTP